MLFNHRKTHPLILLSSSQAKISLQEGKMLQEDMKQEGVEVLFV